MRAMTLSQIQEACSVQIISKVACDFSGIGTDTRKNLQGQLFIAIKGESYDAHQYLDKAVEAGAVGLLVHELPEKFKFLQERVSIFLVPDTLLALQALGRWSRRQFKGPVLGITGSNGKTTTKEFAAAVIGSAKPVHFNRGSFNNHWGVPFTLLQLDTSKQVAIVEMGMNHYGELTDLVKIAEPDVVVCTMVGRAHIEHFGTIEGIAKAKYEIYEAASADCVRVFNLDNPLTLKMMDDEMTRLGPSVQKSFITFSAKDSTARVHLKIKKMNLRELTLEGSIDGIKGEVAVPVFGAQNLTNLMTAAALGLSVGMSAQQVWKGLEACRTNWGRNQLLSASNGAEIIFDAYNANPDSMKALLDNVKEISCEGRKIGVFGEMLEMGSLSDELHRELGAWVGAAGFEKVYFIGKPAAAFNQGLAEGHHRGGSLVRTQFDDEMAQDLVRELQGKDLMVVKGSRGMKLERFVLPCQPLNFSLDKEA